MLAERTDAMPALNRTPPYLLVLAAIAAAGALARDAWGGPLVGSWALFATQILLIGAWLARVYLSSPSSSSPPETVSNTSRMFDRILGGLMVVAAVGIGIARSSLDAGLTALTLFICGSLAVDAGRRLFDRAAAMVDDAPAMVRLLLPTWFAAMVIATAVLSLPISTEPSVPDYRHNFWLHISNNAYAVAAAGCLSGTTIYGYGEDYTFFGQVVLWLLTQLSGCTFAAIGLATMRPFLQRAISLRAVLLWAMGLQVFAAAALYSQWSPADAPTPVDRLWWGAVHGGDAIWNTGLILKANGLAHYLIAGPVYGVITMLAIAGSLGLPLVFDLVLGPGKTNSDKAGQAVEPPWKALPAWEAGAAFWLLLAGAILLVIFETPGWLPDSWTATRPFEFSSRQIALRDDMSLGQRASLAIHLSAMLRSAGIQSIPLSEGGSSYPTHVLMVLWMLVGGSIAGPAGGLRVSTIMLLLICVFSGRHRWSGVPNGEALRCSTRRRLAGFMLLWLAVNAGTALLLALLTDGTRREIVFDSVAAVNTVGLTTGLILHLSWPGRMLLVMAMLAGRLLPVVFWAKLARQLGAAETAIKRPDALRV